MTGFYRLRIFLTGLILLAFCFRATSQNIITTGIGHNLQIESVAWNGKRVELPVPLRFFSVEIDGEMYLSNQFQNHQESFVLKDLVSVKFTRPETGDIFTMQVTMQNISADTLVIENFVPLGRSESHPYITSTGVWNLARSKLFLPGRGPVGVILPDNAWELGYASTPVDAQYSVFALARRTAWDSARRRRYKTDVYPGGTMSWTIWMEPFEGQWQNGLKTAFQQRWLYDLEAFDNNLFERPDLQWIKHQYLITLQMAWDHQYYEALNKQYNLSEFLETGQKYMGGYDVYSIWPTWPRLGVDQRNQWDLYEDLPGGLEKMRELSELCRSHGSKFFIAYNPWDQSTREEDPYKGMARLIEATHADGVVLDTRGSSSYELQRAADSVRSGVVMYSEGMAVPKDMPGIVAGRVHDAIYMPPPLNMNKLIKPDFGIFRVCQLSQGRISREANISLFNGYGVELNTYYPGRPHWIEEEYLYLGKVVKVLRENSTAFNSYDWTPLLPSLTDSIWVN